MIQDIEPKRLFNEYKAGIPGAGARCLAFREREALVKTDGGELMVPAFSEISAYIEHAVYLFRIDGQEYYLATLKNGFMPEGYAFENLHTIRAFGPKDALFAVMTGYHLFVWYRDNRFCGRCGVPVLRDEKQRMLRCPVCGNMIFPKIAPAVIVGVTDGDRILLTRYNGRVYKRYALIAGFTEIGETAEQTVAREVFEEVGLRVKNIRYYASQPWGMESDLLLGYYAELDGSDAVTVDEEELSTAKWFRRSEIDFTPDDISLTNAMIGAFLEGRERG